MNAVFGGSLLRDSRGRGSFSFCRRITSVLSSKMLDLTGVRAEETEPNLSKSKIQLSSLIKLDQRIKGWTDQTHRSTISLSSA